MKSRIYIKCPQCRKTGLLLDRQGKYFCAVCMFDYTSLKNEPDKLDEVLVENIKEPGFGPIYSISLYERVALASQLESKNHIFQLAEKLNIDIGPAKKHSFKLLWPLLILLFIVIAVVIISAIFF